MLGEDVEFEAVRLRDEVHPLALAQPSLPLA